MSSSMWLEGVRADIRAKKKKEQERKDNMEDLLGNLEFENLIQDSSKVEFLPIMHNKDVVILQFHGWSINLHEDGTWIWEATDGG